ncbi:hypothetical protein DFP72DRAFT_1067327 [Ephemerocybe angulata]|uniref:Uncharacterized protein n=1 Tax=Ephemerocybe angulata TaxID=980116 RepID=A0A8H6HZB7_9AGAR|nr:hypothetical protein DFP72DRAFT_1067327 [Tulosesus angulatus]
MGRTKKVLSKSKEFKAFLFDNEALIGSALFAPGVPEQILASTPIHGLLKQEKTWKLFLQQALRNISPNEPFHQALIVLLERELGDDSPAASHQEKRKLAAKLGLLRKPFHVSRILNDAASFEKGAAEILEKYGLKVVLHQRLKDSEHDYKQHKQLVEDSRYAKDGAIICSPEAGFYHILPNESVIIVSSNECDGKVIYSVELVVIRDALAESEFTEPLLNWLSDVVYAATCNRRDVRPNHPGRMVQIGINMGPRHARTLGYAISFTKKLTLEQKAAQDTDLIGALSLLWNLAKAYMPGDVMDEITGFLEDLNYPELGTRHIPSGRGFSIECDGKTYAFTAAGRAPPEGIATWAFHMPTHKDNSPVKWSLALTTLRMMQENSPLQAGYGSNLVDVTLRVVVQSRVATLTAFTPNVLHGTTTHGEGIDPINAGVSLTSTERVYKAYAAMAAQPGGVVFEGEAICLPKD